jgi:ethanolamine utilization protein EutA
VHDDHDHDHDHDHGFPPDAYADLAEIEGMEQYVLTSAGIDIGSSTSQVVVSRLTVRRRGSRLSTEFVVSEREIRYVSPPLLTPYVTGTRMDVAALESFVRTSYEAAGLRPDDVDTGVVVITGEALNKENAEEIAETVARWSGDFICVSAGAHHEALLASHGSGSVALSEREGSTVLNVDIGGGTTKVSLVDRGRSVRREAFSVGARLLAWDGDGRLTRIETPAHVYAAELGLSLRLGGRIDPTDADRLAGLMARVVMDAIEPGPAAALRRRLMVTGPATEGPDRPPPLDRIVFSGGVSEYVDGRETATFGDLGPALGAHLRHELERSGLTGRVTTAEHGIRATVIGASQFSVQASGQTTYVSDERSLPVRSLPVVRVDLSADGDADAAIAEALRRRDRQDLADPIALAVHFTGLRSYAVLRRYADAVVRAAEGHPLHLVLRDDLAQSFGHLLAVEARHPGPVTVVDGITVGDLDHLDIGRPMGSTRSIPVTVKSLAFPH